jgi:hypothetical protein
LKKIFKSDIYLVNNPVSKHNNQKFIIFWRIHIMIASLLGAFFRNPVQVLLILGGASLLAPVVLPVMSLLIRPLVKPATNFFLDLSEDVSEVVQERQQQKKRQGEKEKVSDSDMSQELEDAANVAVLVDTL